MFTGLALMAAGAALLSMRSDAIVGQESPPAANAEQKQPAADWKSLFDGKTLEGWKTPQFGGEGKVHVSDGAIVMEMGAMMTGITWKGTPPKNNYELALEGMRLDGCDFFCTTTFPVGKESCSLVVGGWGGSVVGLSSIDHMDASENATTKTMEFKEKEWYRIRIRVSDSAIQAWINDKAMVAQARKGHKIGIRLEVQDCVPLGVSTWCTKGAVRNIRVRPLTPDEVRIAEVELETANDDR